MATASTVIVRKSQGITRVIRKMANDTVRQHTFLSPKIDFLTIYNAGLNDIKFNFNNHDATLANHYRTLKAGEETQAIGVVKDMTLEFKRITGSANNRIELTLWG